MFWPFKKKSGPPQGDIYQQVIQAAEGSKSQLLAWCRQFKAEAAARGEQLTTVPVEKRQDIAWVNRYIQALGAVAQCLATDCGAPELWQQLTTGPADNPLAQLEKWYGELPQRMGNLEFESLIAEGHQFLERLKTLQGNAVPIHEVFVLGRLGELLFHSGQVAAAVEPFATALAKCRELNDVPGQQAYLNNLVEVHRYLDERETATKYADEYDTLCREHRLEDNANTGRAKTLRAGEPLCRVVCVRDGRDVELADLKARGEGTYNFEFRRNRLPLHKALLLVNQGNELASQGQLADALEKYALASEADPHNPDPVYQSAVCLLDLGAYAKAEEAFAEVERLAPGWFRCRADRWLAAALAEGTVSTEEYQLLRVLDDGNLPAEQALKLARHAVEKYPDFAPFRLALGDALNRAEDSASAIASYRQGLESAEEPDLQSRLMCALAGCLTPDDPERSQLVQQALGLRGSLVAQAMARLIDLK